MSEKTERREFGRVFRRKGSPNWYVRYRVDGREYEESSKSTSRRKAEDLLAQRRTELGLGAFVEPSVRRTTFEQLAEMLLDDYRVNGRRSIDRAELSLTHLREYFGAVKASRITSDRVSAYVRHRQEEGAAPATIQKELAALRRAFRLAERAGKVAAVPHIPQLELDNVRQGFVEEGDLRAILNELTPHVRPLVEFLALTGWRKGEALGLTWRQVDFDAGVVRLEPGTTKNRRGRAFPFGVLPRLEALLREQRQYTVAVERETGSIVPHVFHRGGKRIRDFRGAWEAACVRVGLGHWRDPKRRKLYRGAIVHDLRRSAVRDLIRAGVPEAIAMQLTGHLTASVFKRYAIVDETMLGEGVERLARFHESRGQAAEERKTLTINARTKGATGGQTADRDAQAAGGSDV